MAGVQDQHRLIQSNRDFKRDQHAFMRMHILMHVFSAWGKKSTSSGPVFMTRFTTCSLKARKNHTLHQQLPVSNVSGRCPVKQESSFADVTVFCSSCY